MFSLTIFEAASLLGVSNARVYQLVNQGTIKAEKVGNMWFVSKADVDARLKRHPKTGRPLKMGSSGTGQTYTLLNRNHEVLDFKYDASTGTFSATDLIHDASRAPLGIVSPRGRSVSAKAIAFWWRHRAIPKGRQGLDSKLVQLGIDDPGQLPFTSLGLSLSDQYWIRPLGSTVSWVDVNFFDNGFGELHFDGDWLGEVGLDSPDNTSEGQLSKKWICDGNKRLLLKGGSALNQEPFNEVVATALYSRLLSDKEYVPYTLCQLNDSTVSVCETFVSPDEEYIPAYYVRQIMRQANHHSDYQHYLECCMNLGVKEAEVALAKMIVCDDILGNTDRHWRNFGLIRNVETLEYRIAPLFDTGTSLWSHATEDQLRAGDYVFTTKPFYEDPNRQLRLANDYSWLDIDSLSGFIEETKRILMASTALEKRAEHICEAIQKRIDRIATIL